MPTSCGCHPGTKRSGWMEIRSAKCLKKEHDDFARAVNIDWRSILADKKAAEAEK